MKKRQKSLQSYKVAQEGRIEEEKCNNLGDNRYLKVTRKLFQKHPGIKGKIKLHVGGPQQVFESQFSHSLQ